MKFNNLRMMKWNSQIIVKGMDEYDSNKNLTDYDEENLGCQSGDDDGQELDFG